MNLSFDMDIEDKEGQVPDPFQNFFVVWYYMI